MKYKTKLFSFLLALLVCTATAFAAAPSFTDVLANYWAYNYIEQAAENGWVNGVGNGKYAPEDKVTGAEFVTMVSRVFYQHTMQDPKAGEPWCRCCQGCDGETALYETERGLLEGGEWH